MSRFAFCMTIIAAPLRRKTDMEPGTIPRYNPSKPVARACAFLLRHQRPNGGWGEDFTSCYDKAYAAGGMERWGDGGSGVVNTAWALLALMAAAMAMVAAQPKQTCRVPKQNSARRTRMRACGGT